GAGQKVEDHLCLELVGKGTSSACHGKVSLGGPVRTMLLVQRQGRTSEVSNLLVPKTTFWVYKELEQLVTRIERLGPSYRTRVAHGKKKAVDRLPTYLDEITPTIRLLSYKSRFEHTWGGNKNEFLYSDQPFEEFFLLLHDAEQSNYQFKGPENSLRSSFWEPLREVDLDRVLDAKIRDNLKKNLNK
ncbi:MAG: hypothetical protein HY040_13835, partial [Planctomycetes bacterium]|nr:hypothetical protein [Planctomycetota bacterium]